MGWGRRSKSAAGLLLAAVLCASWACFAVAERHQQGNLILALQAKVSPSALPRHGLAPATITVSSRLSATDGSPPPRARRIELAFAGRSVRFDRAGLPSCPAGRLRNATAAQALARCGTALVGQGRLDAVLLLPHQAPLPIHARLLDFNGELEADRPTVLVHAFSARPPAAFVLPFVSRRRGGAFPNVLTATVPHVAGPWTHLTGFRMTLGRRYRHAGERRSYLNAACPAPPLFTAAFLPFARATYAFAGGRGISTTIVRGCRVRS